MLRAHRLWTRDATPAAQMRAVHADRSWGEGIVQAWCDHCGQLAEARCVHEHGAGLYACMDDAHVRRYGRDCLGYQTTVAGPVWCWGATRQDGIHLWSQYALPEAMMNAACLPQTGGLVRHS